jgi:hypothetical protein
MATFICVTCGTQYPESSTAPAACPICQDERQYVNHNGQQWTTFDDLKASHHNTFTEVEPGLINIHTEPSFAISERANFIMTPQGNYLWDCISLIDDGTVEEINRRGGLKGIAISHPHFYSSMVEWSHAFGGIPIYLHADDSQWVMRPDTVVKFWQGDSLHLNDTLNLIRCGGHFDGSSVMHWASGAGGNGVLFTGDTIYIAEDPRYTTFMYSFPNRLPLSPRRVQHIVDAVEPFRFDRLYDGWLGKVISTGAKDAVKASAARYIKLITES